MVKVRVERMEDLLEAAREVSRASLAAALNECKRHHFESRDERAFALLVAAARFSHKALEYARAVAGPDSGMVDAMFLRWVLADKLAVRKFRRQLGAWYLWILAHERVRTLKWLREREVEEDDQDAARQKPTRPAEAGRNRAAKSRR